MGFDFKYRDDTKQNINLSEYAFYIMSCDVAAFTNKRNGNNIIGSGFLNRIFQNFYTEANATIGLLLKRKKEEFEEIIRPLNCDGKEELIREYMKRYERQLPKECYLKGRHFNFRMQKETKRILSECVGDTQKYYTSARDSSACNVGKYLKAVFEEYALLPYFKREEVYFKEEIQIISDAIESSRMITYTYRNANYSMHPYRVELDEWSSYHYLIGVTEKGKLLNCRISYMEHIKKAASAPRFSTEEKKTMNNLIIESGVQFVMDKAIDIKVKLTEHGKKMYERMVFLRPQFISAAEAYEADGEKYYIYQFHCCKAQAEFYFFKIGADAVILEPQQLREEFRKKYQKALHVYDLQ